VAQAAAAANSNRRDHGASPTGGGGGGGGAFACKNLRVFRVEGPEVRVLGVVKTQRNDNKRTSTHQVEIEDKKRNIFGLYGIAHIFYSSAFFFGLRACDLN
jgi:hypothetical protein